MMSDGWSMMPDVLTADGKVPLSFPHYRSYQKVLCSSRTHARRNWLPPRWSYRYSPKASAKPSSRRWYEQLMVQGSLFMVHSQHWYMIHCSWFRVHCSWFMIIYPLPCCSSFLLLRSESWGFCPYHVLKTQIVYRQGSHYREEDWARSRSRLPLCRL